MIAGSVASWAVVAASGRGVALETLAGMIAPLVVASSTLAMAERIYSADPARLTGFMMTAFAAKLVVFGGYVALALAVLGLRPIPFIAAFTGYFIALHMIEALYLRRLFVGDTRASR